MTDPVIEPAHAAPRPFPHRASYSPQDDKLRLFLSHRLGAEEWADLKAEGWIWTPKQSGDLVAPWTPDREDRALALAGEIEDEDEPREERSADRAERFAGYGGRREDEAEALADRYEGQPRIHGAQDAARAERAAERHARIGERARDKWRSAEYWTARTRGVIRHALYLEAPGVRHRRIKGLEAEERGLVKRQDEAAVLRAAWLWVAEIRDPDKQIELALRLSGSSSDWRPFEHPRIPGRTASLWTLLQPDLPPGERLTGAEAAALSLSRMSDPRAPGSMFSRWVDHVRLRLAYERQMLEAQGGTLANVAEIVPGGFLGRHQIVKVTKDRAGRVSKVYVLAPTSNSYDREGRAYGPDNPAPLEPLPISAERLDPTTYRAPTAEEAAAFAESQKLAKALAKAAAPPTPPLLNPDDESAERLQALWNARARAEAASVPVEDSKVVRMTRERWAEVSRGTYAPAEVCEIRADGTRRSKSNMYSPLEARRDKVPVAFRLRVAREESYRRAPRVVVLTDAPRAPLPAIVEPSAEERP